jgi:hypothetical protein
MSQEVVEQVGQDFVDKTEVFELKIVPIKMSLIDETQCKLRRAYASLDDRADDDPKKGYWRTGPLKDARYGSVMFGVKTDYIRDLKGHIIEETFWIQPQEGIDDDEIFRQLFIEKLISAYNYSKRTRNPLFDERTVIHNGLNRDHVHFILLKQELDYAYMSKQGFVLFNWHNPYQEMDEYKQIQKRIIELEHEYEKYRAMVCPPN